MNAWVAVDGWFGALGRAVFPPTCALCGEAGAAGRDLCAVCACGLPLNRPCCPSCALPLEAPAAACGLCLRRPPPFDATIAPLRYAWPLDRLVTRYKFAADLAVGRVLADLVTDALRAARRDVDFIVPVPLHPRRLRERGFNQALELARPIARALQLPLDFRALTRPRATAAQSGLDAKARRRNVRGAFEAHLDLGGRRIAVVDDVVTTTATVRECARVLKRAGAAHVEVWAIARAPGPAT